MKIIAILVTLLMVAFFIWQWRSMRKAQQTVGQAAPDTSSVDGAVDATRKVYFMHARHCRPCRAIEPLVDQLRTQHPNLIKLEISEHMALARAFRVAGTPSFIAVQNGTISAVKLGAVSEDWLLQHLQG